MYARDIRNSFALECVMPICSAHSRCLINEISCYFLCRYCVLRQRLPHYYMLRRVFFQLNLLQQSYYGHMVFQINSSKGNG